MSQNWITCPEKKKKSRFPAVSFYMRSYSHWLLSHSWKYVSGCSIFYDTPITDTVKELVVDLHKACCTNLKNMGIFQDQMFNTMLRLHSLPNDSTVHSSAKKIVNTDVWICTARAAIWMKRIRGVLPDKTVKCQVLTSMSAARPCFCQRRGPMRKPFYGRRISACLPPAVELWNQQTGLRRMFTVALLLLAWAINTALLFFFFLEHKQEVGPLVTCFMQSFTAHHKY